jgi:colicin import membrane protein
MADNPPADPPEPPPPPQDPPGPPAPPSPPPAAKTVLTGTKTERELALEREVEQSKTALKQRESRINELEDENRQLKTPPPGPAKEAKKKKKRFLEGATFFD